MNNNLLYWETELEGLSINTDWNSTTELDIVENKPEVGNPIRRLRSSNIKYTLNCTMDMSYDQLNTKFAMFILNTHGGIDPFYFKSFLDSEYYETTFVISNGQPYTVKRKDENAFTVSFTLEYVKIGEIVNA